MSPRSLITCTNAIFVIVLLCSIRVETLGAGVELPLPSVKQLVFADQRLAVVYPVIQLFKNLITSDPFKVTASWTGSDVCSYRGFFCESPPDNKSAMALASIDFNGFQLSAPTLDGFLDQLQDIALFHANSNNFGGTISPSVAKLPYLYELDISNNQFSGPFPSAILGMQLLSFLDVRFNSFSGSVPAELFSKELDVLFLNDNVFTTRLPDNIPATHIPYLTLANNKFFGPIPHSIARIFAGSTEVILLNNLLTGCLPFEIGLLKEVVILDIGNNHLTGPLPFSFGCLQNLELLNLAGNQFHGSVPEMLCALGNLGNLSLSDNYFSHIGPICFSLFQSGVLDLKKNCILGLPFQRSIAECAMFFSRPRYCPFMASFMHIPCWLPQFKSTLAPSPS